NTDAAFRVQDAALRVPRTTLERFNQGDFTYTKGIPQDISTALTFKHHLCGKGATGAIPAWASTFLTACGMSLSTATYSTTSTTSDWKTITAGLYQDGRLKLARGMMGN